MLPKLSIYVVEIETSRCSGRKAQGKKLLGHTSPRSLCMVWTHTTHPENGLTIIHPIGEFIPRASKCQKTFFGAGTGVVSEV